MKAVRSGALIFLPPSCWLSFLCKEGFQAFMVTQIRVHDDGKRGKTKHMIRLHYASQINGVGANEIVQLNSYDGPNSHQMLAGMFRLCPSLHRRSECAGIDTGLHIVVCQQICSDGLHQLKA
ncbi:DUF932 domain-containing protein [Pectobacterium aroidearum]|uniref:DUF932 domain-containing protein n=1 Tax=Pectobacterium aroidearum TaxID=1201031 RepID=UPI003D9A3A58